MEISSMILSISRLFHVSNSHSWTSCTLLAALGNREVPVPEAIDIFYLDQEMAPSDKTPLEAVMEVDNERKVLEAQVDILQETDPESPFLMDLYT